jgi:ribosomal-protein-alanine N-acetyltransferase
MKLPPVIETARLIIRRHLPEDAESFVEFMTDEDATRFLDFEPEQKTPAGARGLLDYVISTYSTEDPVFALAIVDKATGAFMGSCGLSRLADQPGVECYYSLLPRYWGWGFATEAGLAMLYYAFEELGLATVVAHVSAKHSKAWSVARNMGMTDKGPCDYKGMPDCHRFEITREEWQELTATRNNRRPLDAG